MCFETACKLLENDVKVRFSALDIYTRGGRYLKTVKNVSVQAKSLLFKKLSIIKS